MDHDAHQARTPLDPAGLRALTARLATENPTAASTANSPGSATRSARLHRLEDPAHCGPRSLQPATPSRTDVTSVRRARPPRRPTPRVSAGRMTCAEFRAPTTA